MLWLNEALRGKAPGKWVFGGRRFQPQEVMLVFSHCLQNSECQQKIVIDLANCKRCGKCTVKGILELAEKYHIRCAAASGGEMALQKVGADSVKAVLAIACEKELAAGIRAIYPKHVVAVKNTRPKGPCKDCQVDLQAVEEGIRKIIKNVSAK